MDFNHNLVLPTLPYDSMPAPPNLKEAKQNNKEKNLQSFWEKHMLDKEIKTQLPVARIRRIMKCDADMVSGDSQVLMAQICEIFIQELTYRAFFITKEKKKRVVKTSHIAKAIMETNLFDFLMDIANQYSALDVKGKNVEEFKDANQENAGNVFEGNQLNVEDFVNIGNQDALPHAEALVENENPMTYMDNEQMEVEVLIQSFMMQPPSMV